MNFKSLIISALLTLIVTIIGGAAVDYITTEKPWKKNKLEYSYKRTGNFQSGAEKVEFSRLEIKNTGSQIQKSIKTEIQFKDTKIQDFTISESTKSLNPKIEKSESNGKITIDTETLFPKENIVIELFTKAQQEEIPAISIRSKTTNGIPYEDKPETSESLFGQTAKT